MVLLPVQAQDVGLLRVQPMVVPLLPWRSPDSGGLLFTLQLDKRISAGALTGIRLHANVVRPGLCAAALQGWMLPVQTQDVGLLKVLPMVVPPLPWRSTDSGGLLFTRQHVMRMRSQVQVQALQEAETAPPDGMRKVSHTCLSE